jgi:ABC-type dipeptide/oligopeptide/nickel transport system permease component
MIEVLSMDYIKTARSKGVAERAWCGSTPSGTPPSP